MKKAAGAAASINYRGNYMKRYIMALDQGTTSSRTILFDEEGLAVGTAQQEFTQYYPGPGWVEHDPMEIWQSQLAVARQAIENAGVAPEAIAAIGITNQRETTIVWDRRTGVPVYRAIVWQCRRTAQMVDGFDEGFCQYIRKTTGLVPDAYFSASKVKWILDNVPGAREEALAGNLLFGTIDTWLIWNLTGGRVFVTDYTNASRTMMFDIHNRCWDDHILETLGIPKAMLPKVCPSSCVYGETDPEIFGVPVKIAGAAGDQQAALFGQCCFDPGDVKNTYGTGCFLLMNTGRRAVVSSHGLVTTIAASCSDDVEYALEGSVFVAGASIQWLRDSMKMIESAPASEALAAQVEDTEGVYIVPAFTGLGAPYWNPYARGMVVGLTRGSENTHFVRATLESIAYQTYDVLKAMEKDMGACLKSLKVDGGAAANGLLMQFQSDILRTDVLKPEYLETTALGAAYLAGLAVGYWQNKDEIRTHWKLRTTYHPQMDADAAKVRLAGWKKAVKCALVWASEEA